MTKTAKLFTNGGSQAVRLPAEFRFDGEVVYIHRDPASGDVVLSSRARADWQRFMALRARLPPVPEDFLAEREQPAEQRDPLAVRARRKR
jgi:antitoxin VapB